MPLSKTSLTATSTTIREINRSIILNLVRLHEPISRKEISKLSGMFPSNVSAVVDELLHERLLIEQRARPLKPGRTPVNLFLNPGALRVLGVNLRAENTTVAWAGLSGDIIDSISFKTPHRPETLLREISNAVKTARKRKGGLNDAPLHAVGVSVPGIVEPTRGIILMTPTLPHFRKFPLATGIAKELGAPVLAENDSNVTMLGEQWFGRKELANLENAVLLSISDFGVGSGLLFNSSLYRGHNKTWAGEFGHMVIDREGPRCRCGRRGCWERYVCNEATLQRYDPSRNYTPTAFNEMIERALGGEKKAVHAFEETADYLSLGLSNITFALNPDAIVVGGAITKVWKLVRHAAEEAWRSPGIQSPIMLTRWTLDELHLKGAVALALQDVFAAPRVGLHSETLKRMNKKPQEGT